MVQKANPAIKVYSAGVLQRNLGAIRKEIPGAFQSRDIEYVHRMRVAARRLETALTVFHEIYPAKRVKAWEKETRQIARVLGRARDLDIQIMSIREILSRILESRFRPGIRRLLLRSTQKRSKVQCKLFKELEGFNHNQTISTMEIQISHVFEKHGAPIQNTGSELQAYAKQAIAPVFMDFLGYDPFVDKVEAVKELHAMRLAAKRLRYTMECFVPVFDGEFEAELTILRKTQDLLGVIHDCDVWEMNRQGYIEQERTRTRNYFGSERSMDNLLPGLEYFYKQLQLKRHQTYIEFVHFWGELREDHYWNGVAKRFGWAKPMSERKARTQDPRKEDNYK